MMGETMAERGEGEMMEARRRRLFWWTVGILFAAGAALGAFIGVNGARRGLPFDQVWSSLSAPVVAGLVVVGLIAFVIGTWRFVKVIDEVELIDNLWGSMASYYVYATLFPVWWALGKVGILPEPQDWTIYFVALAGGGVVYLWRKWRAR